MARGGHGAALTITLKSLTMNIKSRDLSVTFGNEE